MQNSQLPAKWFKPFAADDSAKVEIPLTTADPTRASQSLGFPPLTMQPPESGGVPPQGEDFNGAMNQVARFVWWMLGGGALPFDNAWATNAAIGGYPQGAVVTSADLQGEWISAADNNTNNPDTVGTGWVPGFNYGATAVTGLAAANVTLTPAQAAKPVITLAGTLTANIQLIFPTWRSQWLIVNNTTGAFSVTCKTAAGAGVVVPQSGQQAVWGDGTNLNATRGSGQYLNTQVFLSTGVYTPTPGTTKIRVRAIGGGGAGGGGAVNSGTVICSGSGGAMGSYAEAIYTTGFAGITITVGAGGAGVAGTAGGPGGTTSVGALLTCPGGGGGQATQTSTSTTAAIVGQGTPGNVPTGSGITFAKSGQPGPSGINFGSANLPFPGQGAPSPFGGGGPNVNTGAGTPAGGYGAGGGGAATLISAATAVAGGSGGAGLVIIEEYA